MMNKQKGFSLLEVIVAMAIVSLVLGTIFGLFAGSKRLAFKAADSIDNILFLRAAFNMGQLLEETDYPEYPESVAKELSLRADDLLEPPNYLKDKMQLGLEPYAWVNKTKETEWVGIRWKKLETVN